MARLRLYGEVDVVAPSKDKNYSYIPKNYTIPTDADYFEICCNNTIEGTEIRKDIDSPVPLIADMSSDIFSRPVDVSKYAMIFGGAQKNFAPAGVTMVIINDKFMNEAVCRPVPTMADYRVHAKKNSMNNTPPVLPIFTALKTMEWMEAEGGVKEMEKRAIARSTKVYDCLERKNIRISKLTSSNWQKPAVSSVSRAIVPSAVSALPATMPCRWKALMRSSKPSMTGMPRTKRSMIRSLRRRKWQKF